LSSFLRENTIFVPRRVLVLRTDRIGDVVLSTPVLTALRNHFGNAFIAIMVRPYTVELVRGHPHANAILMDDQTGRHAGIDGFFRLLKMVRHYHFDTALLLHPSFRLTLLCFLAGIPHRVGTAYRFYSFLFNLRIRHHRKGSGRHELDLNLDLARAIGATLHPVRFFLSIPSEAGSRVEQLLHSVGINTGESFIVIHPGSGGSAMDWPISSFAELADRVQEEMGVPVVVTGNKAERALVGRMCALMRTNPVRVDGLLTIKELLALLSRTRVLVANSTGPLHMGVAVGCQVVGLYCPLLACAPVRWGPYGRPDSVLQPPVPACRKCTRERCEKANCMELITPDQVFAKVKSKFAS
jgi:heptosyltransferase-2